jgi:hypothetical protein
MVEILISGKLNDQTNTTFSFPVDTPEEKSKSLGNVFSIIARNLQVPIEKMILVSSDTELGGIKLTMKESELPLGELWQKYGEHFKVQQI